tara:strand:+ start:9 stop:866 length:858 start_codon:yes stop_codon:yes gene_type:complete
MKRVFVLGNGQSRVGVDLEKLREHGKIYGCNAIYRDFKTDVLVGVDQGVMHEMYHSGICEKIPTYFRNWSKVPIDLYENMIKAGATDEDLRLAKAEGAFYENERTPECKEFVMHGSSVAGVAHVVRSDKTKHRKYVQQKSIKISWLRPGNKSKCLNDIEDFKDKGWAAGPTAVYISCLLEKPDEVYLIGHDLNSTTGKVNNIYAGTPNYVLKDHAPTPSVNWVSQLKETFFDFSGKHKHKRVMFYKVQNSIRGGDEVNRVVREWTDHKGNLDYISFDELYKKFGI